MNQNPTLNQEQAQRGYPYIGDVDALAHPLAWRFGVEIKGILFMRVAQQFEDLNLLREQHPGVFILPYQERHRDFGDFGREELGQIPGRSGVLCNRFRYNQDVEEFIVPHPARNVTDENLVPLPEARRLGHPHPEYRRWTIKDNASVGINVSDVHDFLHIVNYHSFSFELVSPILPNTDEGFQELARVMNVLYSRELFFNDTGGIDVHVGIDQYMIPLPVVRRIAAVTFACDLAMVRSHYDCEQDNNHRLMIRNTSNVAHGLTVQQAQTHNMQQLDGTVEFLRRDPPRISIDQGTTQSLNAGSYVTLHKLLSIDRGNLPANYNFPTYEIPRKGGRPIMCRRILRRRAIMICLGARLSARFPNSRCSRSGLGFR